MSKLKQKAKEYRDSEIFPFRSNFGLSDVADAYIAGYKAALEDAAKLAVFPKCDDDEEPYFGEHAEDGWERARAHYREKIRALGEE